ncbi:MAG: TVP38/TMEM64 family protein [Planctomycetia bacterium]|nr:TVP38/TMEM64 family protein [Planctomycetia bacterium]
MVRDSYDGSSSVDSKAAGPGGWLLVATAVLLLGVLYWMHPAEWLSWEVLQARRAELEAQVAAHPVRSGLVYIAVYLAATTLALPITPVLTVAGGWLFGRWPGLVLVSCASTTGACLAFAVSRYLFRDWVERRWGTRLAPLRRGVERDGAFYLLALRLSPLVPFSLINVGMGLTPLRLRTFWWVSQLGMVPISFLFVHAGDALGGMTSPADILSPPVALALSLAALVPLALRVLWNRYQAPGA